LRSRLGGRDDMWCYPVALCGSALQAKESISRLRGRDDIGWCSIEL